MQVRSPFALLLLVTIAVLGCGAPRDATAPQGPLSTCVVDVAADVEAVVAFDDGVAFAHDTRVFRTRGAGCDLTQVGLPVAAEELLDVDDDGNLYVFPAAGARCDVSTMLEGEYPQSMVARVAMEDDQVTKLLPAGRGIWSFGISPDGDALWVDACGPTGLFEVTADGVAASSLEPPTHWGVFTDKRTFWSVGPRTCDPTVQPTSELTDACGHALVRTTPAGDVEVGTTVVDFGAGFEQGALARCGAHVCGVFASAVVVWDDAGTTIHAIERDDVAAAADEVIASVTGNGNGLYVTLRSDTGARVVFVPRQW